MLKTALLVGIAAVAATAVSAPVSAAVVYYSGYTTAVGPSGFTPVVGFTAPGGADVDITVTDCCIAGDYYKTWVDGTYVGTTPVVAQYGAVLSMGTFGATLGPGMNHTYQLQDQWLGLLPAGVYVSIAAPEPSTWAMMTLGFAGLAFAGYRASKKQVAAVA